MIFLRILLTVFCAILLTSCQALREEADPNIVSVRGVKPTLEQLNITNTTTAQNAFVYDLFEKAGYSGIKPGTTLPLPLRDPGWSLIAEAGIYEISRQCDQYLDVLFHFNRNQRALRQGLTATGAATATILGLASVAAAPIAITAAAFGLSASLFDAGVNSVLFTIEPSALRNIVNKGRKGYLDNLKMDEISSRPRMMIALQGYLVQCSPPAIEANVNNAASGADSVASADSKTSQDAAKLAAPAASSLMRSTVKVDKPAAATPPLPTSIRATGALGSEENVSKDALQRVQRALNVGVDGDFGSFTRNAIREFQLGWNRRDGDLWGADEVTGELSRRSVDMLPYLSPMPAIFRTPFERAFLGNMDGPSSQRLTRFDANRLNALIAVVSGNPAPPGDTPEALATKMQALRSLLNAVRVKDNISPANGGVLDAALYDKLIAR